MLAIAQSMARMNRNGRVAVEAGRVYIGCMTIDRKMARKRLTARKTDLVELSELSEDARAPVELDQQAVGRLSRMDALQNQAMQQATERARKRDLVRIDMAERRLAEGGYGYCEECGGEIPDGRLVIDPMAERCVNCAGRPGVIPPVRPGRR